MDDELDQTDHDYHQVLAAGDDGAYRSLKMTSKVPPAFGHVQTNGYFAYEESVEWESIKTIEQKFRGPHPRNRLVGEAVRLKPLFSLHS